MSNIFTGLKVIDFTSNLAGPLCTQILGDYGAEVWKIERPGAGDDSRGVAPKIDGQSLFYMFASRSKKSVTLALDDPRAQKVIYEMVKEADVFIESYPPGRMKKFNLDYETISKINPSIIYCSVSVAGQVGPHSKVPGFDIIAQAMSGMMDITGEKDGGPTKNGTVIGDYIGGLNAAISVISALYKRKENGQGCYIDVSLVDGLIAVNTLCDQAATLHTHPTRSGSHHGTIAPYGVYFGNNGESCIVAAYTGKMWPKLCQLIGHPELEEDERFNSNAARCANLPELVEIIESWLKTFDKIDDAVAAMKAEGIATCKICSTTDVVNDQSYYDNGLFIEIPPMPACKTMDKVITRGSWLRFSNYKPEYKRPCDLGEYNYEVLGKYMTREEIDQCMQDWAGKFKKQ